MILDEKTKEVVKEFAPHIEDISAGWKTMVFGLVAIIFFGIYALYRQVVDGHIITGMRDNVVWGLYIVNFIFFIGISYAGALISGILHLLKEDWRKPIIRIAKIITIISGVIGPVYILLCVGRLDRLHHLFLFGRIQSPIMWDVIAVTTYVSGAILFLYLSMVRDFAILRDYPQLKVGKFRRWTFKILAIGYNGTPKQDKLLDDSLNIMSAILIPVAIIVNSILAWIFSMTLRPGWHSTIFGPYFVIGAIFTGTGVLIMVLWAYRKIYHLEKHITEKHFNYLGILFMVLSAIYGYFTLSEYLTEWYSSKVWENHLLSKLFSFQEYGWWFFFSAVVGVVLPIIVIGIPKLRSINSIAFVSVVAVFALWVKRYLIIVPTLETPLIPLQENRIEWIKYSATWVEWALTFGGVATFILFFMLLSKYMPIISIRLAAGTTNGSGLLKNI